MMSPSTGTGDRAWELPTHIRGRRPIGSGGQEAADVDQRALLSEDNDDRSADSKDGENAFARKARRRLPGAATAGAVRGLLGPKRLVALAVVAGFVLGYYAQVLVFFCHVRLGWTAAILPTTERSLVDKLTQGLIEQTKRVVFVCRKTNWDFVGLMATPHTVLFAHEDVAIPRALDETLAVVRHTGTDSYLNLHNKTLTIMSHVHRLGGGGEFHFYKQDDEAVVFWPHYYQCLRQCKNLDTCYAGDMHVNIGDAANANSYVFATGGSYFVGRELLRCLLERPAYVTLDGLDFGEDKTVGKMLHFNKCPVQYVSCKWFNNKEIYSPNALVRMQKGATTRYIHEDTVLLSQQEQAPPSAPDV